MSLMETLNRADHTTATFPNFGLVAAPSKGDKGHMLLTLQNAATKEAVIADINSKFKQLTRG